NTTLTVTALGLDPDGTTTISMRQDIGRTWHSVQKLVSGTSRYDVTTPTVTATVRGTMFAVGVTTDTTGEAVSTVATVEGAVAAAKPAVAGQPPEEVLVTPGLRATVKVSAPIDPPAPAPEPDRKVVITLGAASGVVVDSVGRSNGIVNGKFVVQTPGATVL